MECPLGYICESMGVIAEDEKWNSKCENEEGCEHFTLSWNLPYEYDEDGALVVTNDPARFHWKKELNGNGKFNLENNYCPLKGMEAGFYYRAIFYNQEEKIDYRQVIREEWKKAGWAMASPIRETEEQARLRKLRTEVRRAINEIC